MSKHSPGPVKDSELVSRFVFSPIHTHKKTGSIMPSVFGHAFSKGCSIQRETKASDEEITKFVTDFLSLDQKFSWQGVLFANCGDLRKITVESSSKQALCVYDTAELDNVAHAEFGQSQQMPEADLVELRHDIYQAFSKGQLVLPQDYRGNLPKEISSGLQSQINFSYT